MAKMTKRAGNLLLILLLFAGCSSPIVPGNIADNAIRPIHDGARQTWAWGHWMFYVSESHNSIEVIHIRETNWHFNVVNFLEKAPCVNCLQIGPPQPQPDGTVKFKVTLRHPFPGHLEFTGFDVRGIAMFPSTRHWEASQETMSGWPWETWPGPYKKEPLWFSWSGDNGASLINDEGCSFYFWPGFDIGKGYELPIFKYQKGKYSSESLPDSTVNPYLNFNDGSPRRMFKSTDIIQRTYHLRLPQGPFSFGYAVLAAWVPPIKTPVTNPAEDFPVYANSEDAVDLYFNQYKPMDPNNSHVTEHPKNPFAVVRYKYYPHLRQDIDFLDSCWLFSPDIPWDPPDWFHWDGGVGGVSHESPYWPPVEDPPNTYLYYLYCLLPKLTNPNPYSNGIYPALFIVGSRWDQSKYPFYKSYPATLLWSITFKIVDLNLQASDG